MLRIDVDHYNSSHAYSVPSCNPFVGVNSVRAEIFSYGLRNPWRCSFDRGDAITGKKTHTIESTKMTMKQNQTGKRY